MNKYDFICLTTIQNLTETVAKKDKEIAKINAKLDELKKEISGEYSTLISRNDICEIFGWETPEPKKQIDFKITEDVTGARQMADRLRATAEKIKDSGHVSIDVEKIKELKAAGKSNKEIAEELGYSCSSVTRALKE